MLLEQALQIKNTKLYQGQFENGVASGIASIIFSNESSPKDWDKYEGFVRSGKLNGYGKLSLCDGTVVEGTWVDN